MVIKWLGRAAGGELLIIALLGGSLIYGGGYLKGKEAQRSWQEKKNLKMEKKLNEKSDTVTIDTDEIVKKLNGKINLRVSSQSQINTNAIEESARKVGKLEGQAEGYRKGFEDAEKTLRESCFTDPAFLSNRMRLDAISRYEAIFGSTKVNESLAGASSLFSNPHDDARGYQTD